MLTQAIEKVHRFVTGGSPVENRLRKARHATPTDAEREEGKRLVSEWAKVNSAGRDLALFPLRRRAVVELAFGKKLEDITDEQDAQTAQQCAIAHDKVAIGTVNERLREMHGKINAEALVLLETLNRRYSDEVRIELNKAREKFASAYADHGCGDETEGQRPVQTLLSEYERRRDGGRHNLALNGPADGLADFGVVE